MNGRYLFGRFADSLIHMEISLVLVCLSLAELGRQRLSRLVCLAWLLDAGADDRGLIVNLDDGLYCVLVWIGLSVAADDRLQLCFLFVIILMSIFFGNRTRLSLRSCDGVGLEHIPWILAAMPLPLWLEFGPFGEASQLLSRFMKSHAIWSKGWKFGAIQVALQAFRVFPIVVMHNMLVYHLFQRVLKMAINSHLRGERGPLLPVWWVDLWLSQAHWRSLKLVYQELILSSEIERVELLLRIMLWWVRRKFILLKSNAEYGFIVFIIEYHWAGRLWRGTYDWHKLSVYLRALNLGGLLKWWLHFLSGNGALCYNFSRFRLRKLLFGEPLWLNDSNNLQHFLMP